MPGCIIEEEREFVKLLCEYVFELKGNMNFSEEELLRYHRQIIIPGFGEEGQEKLKNARIFIAGVGGLGSISSYYLTAAGIGHLTIVDRDKVSGSNLNRQILHWTDDIDREKTDSACAKLRRLNPHCKIQALQCEMTEENCEDLIGDCSIIVDATDNLEARRILNIASIRKRIPFIYGGVNQLDGLASTFIPGQTPCFECVFPYMGPQEAKPFGIIGAVPGVIASIQTVEAMKLILGMEGLLAGRLLCFSGHDMSFREFKLRRNPECSVCKGIT
jgi:molybdopterin/thiamine biosynthesis adenylyltransferase